MKNYIYSIRSRKGITLSQLASLSNVGKTTINNIENGKKNPNVITAFKIAMALNVSVLDLFEMEEEDFYIIAHKGDVVVEDDKKEIIRLLDDIQDRRFIRFVLSLIANHNK